MCTLIKNIPNNGINVHVLLRAKFVDMDSIEIVYTLSYLYALNYIDIKGEKIIKNDIRNIL